MIQKLIDNGMLIQVNASFFERTMSKRKALRLLDAGCIHLIGSDCHNLESRPANLGAVQKLTRDNHAEQAFQQLHQNAAKLLMNRWR